MQERKSHLSLQSHRQRLEEDGLNDVEFIQKSDQDDRMDEAQVDKDSSLDEMEVLWTRMYAGTF